MIGKYRDEFYNSKGKKKQTIDPKLQIGIVKLRKRMAKKNDIIKVSDKGNDLVMTSVISRKVC